MTYAEIDWTQPLELVDGTPVMLAPGDFPNPDKDGDAVIMRTDGEPFTAEQSELGAPRLNMIVTSIGQRWYPLDFDRNPDLIVRNNPNMPGAKAPEPVPATDWQDIATAPREKHVLVDDPRFGITEGFLYGNGVWHLASFNGQVLGGLPTKWRHLPDREEADWKRRYELLAAKHTQEVARLRDEAEKWQQAAHWFEQQYVKVEREAREAANLLSPFARIDLTVSSKKLPSDFAFQVLHARAHLSAYKYKYAEAMV